MAVIKKLIKPQPPTDSNTSIKKQYVVDGRRTEHKTRFPPGQERNDFKNNSPQWSRSEGKEGPSSSCYPPSEV